jgi:hypothetical protein
MLSDARNKDIAPSEPSHGHQLQTVDGIASRLQFVLNIVPAFPPLGIWIPLPLIKGRKAFGDESPEARCKASLEVMLRASSGDLQ